PILCLDQKHAVAVAKKRKARVQRSLFEVVITDANTPVPGVSTAVAGKMPGGRGVVVVLGEREARQFNSVRAKVRQFDPIFVLSTFVRDPVTIRAQNLSQAQGRVWCGHAQFVVILFFFCILRTGLGLSFEVYYADIV